MHSGKDELPAHRSRSGIEDTQKKKCLSGASPPPGRTAHFKQAELNQVSLERVLVLHLILISEMLLLFEMLELMRFHLHEPQTH